MSADSHSLDSLMDRLGDFGKYQGWQFALHILSAVTAGINMLSLVTVAAVPDHQCKVPTNGTAINSCFYVDAGNSTHACREWIYDQTYYKSSRAIEWNMVCDQRWMGAVAQATYMAGVLTGAIILGNLADKIGRKPVFCVSGVLQLLLGIGVAFVPEYYSFLVMRFIYGIFGSAGAYIPGFVLTMELVGPSKRSMCGVSFQAAFAFGIMLVAGWGSFIKDRQLLQIIYGSHAIVFFAHIWLMDESPRWLWGKGRIKESVAIIQKALRMNRKSDNIDVAEYVSRAGAQTRQAEVKSGLLDLFKTPNLRKRTLNICLCWFANSIVYYGLSLSTGSMKGNPYLIIFIMGAVELPSYVIIIYLMDRIGRRGLTGISMIFGGICCISAAMLAKGSIVSVVFVMIGKFLIAGSFAIIYNYSAELFPTVVRNSGMGLGSMAARASGTLTPLLLLFDTLDARIPSIIFAAISLVSGTMVLFLPETLHKAMPQSIADGEKFGLGDTFFKAVARGKCFIPDVERDNEGRAGASANGEQLEPLNKK